MTRIGSLCTGYGGLDLAVAEVFGGDTVWVADVDPDASLVLARRFPGVPNLGDITAIDWPNRLARADTFYPTPVTDVDILTAGYPCQPFSVAGHRKGTEDDRHLWPSIANAVRSLRPRLVVLENVGGHLTLGFDEVVADLAEVGYVGAWACIRASDVGAPHRRERLFVVAHAECQPDQLRRGPRRLARAPQAQCGEGGRQGDKSGAAAGDRSAADRRRFGRWLPAVERWERVVGPAPDPVAAGKLNAPFVEWMMGLPEGWVTDVLPRRPALHVLGNGVVPQQAIAALHMLTS